MFYISNYGLIHSHFCTSTDSQQKLQRNPTLHFHTEIFLLKIQQSKLKSAHYLCFNQYVINSMHYLCLNK